MNSNDAQSRRDALAAITRSKEDLEKIVQSSDDLSYKRIRADVHMKVVLEYVLPLLPNEIQRDVQECIALNECIWNIVLPPVHLAVPVSQTDGSPSRLQAD